MINGILDLRRVNPSYTKLNQRERERERTGTGSVRNLLVAETNATE